MNCYEFQDSISSYIEKELVLAEIKLFDKHLKSCFSCKDTYEGVVSAIGVLRNSERIVASSEFNSALRARIRAVSSQQPVWHKRYVQHGRIFGFEPRYLFASVAAMAVIVMLSFDLIPESGDSIVPNPVPLSTQQNMTGTVDSPPPLPLNSDAKALLADEDGKDSTETEADGKITKPALGGKIKLVKKQK
jgi:hypothetical protein|tara:strand:+ start:6977 stop:7546 length:570 start_codon:yes stop_codon:yes gene_type:complete